MDRRALFFLGAAVVCALLVPVANPDHRWVAIGLSALYVVLALASYLDFRSRLKRSRSWKAREAVVPEQEELTRV